VHIQHTIPSWVVRCFLIFAIVHFSASTHSTLLLGVFVQRWSQTQAIPGRRADSILACGLTIWAMFHDVLALYKEFVGVIIVWIAPWLGII